MLLLLLAWLLIWRAPFSLEIMRLWLDGGMDVASLWNATIPPPPHPSFNTQSHITRLAMETVCWWRSEQNRNVCFYFLRVINRPIVWRWSANSLALALVDKDLVKYAWRFGGTRSPFRQTVSPYRNRTLFNKNTFSRVNYLKQKRGCSGKDLPVSLSLEFEPLAAAFAFFWGEMDMLLLFCGWSIGRRKEQKEVPNYVGDMMNNMILIAGGENDFF